MTVVLVLGALSTTSYAQSQDEVAKQFVGMWRLVSWPQRLADGTTRQNPLRVSYIIYTDRVGIDRKRWFKFEGPNRVALRVDTAELNPPVVESPLIWERVTK